MRSLPICLLTESWLRSPSSGDRRQTHVEGNKDMLWILYQPWLNLRFILVLGLIWCSWKGQAVSADKSLPDSQEAMGEFYVQSICLHPSFLVYSTTCPGLCPPAMQPAPILTITRGNRHIPAELLPNSHGQRSLRAGINRYRYSRGIPKERKQCGKVKSWATILSLLFIS